MSGWNCPIINSIRYNPKHKKKNREALHAHYDRLERMVRGVANNKWHLIVNGPAGSGKTEFVNDVLMDMWNDGKKKRELLHEPLMLSGTMSAVSLFATLYHHRHEGKIVVIDDTDKILEDVECLEVLKASCDTKKNKKVSWKKYSTALKQLNAKDTFEYHGRVIVITNKLMRTIANETPTVWQTRVLPLFSRFQYYRAGLQQHWAIEALKMFADPKELRFNLRCFEETDLSDKVKQKLINWMVEHQDNLREISFRTVASLVALHEEEPEFWEDLAQSSEFH